MKKLWQIWIKALEYGLDTDDLYFDVGASFSPYEEVTLKSFGVWNEKLFSEIAVNPFYSHDEIFRHILMPVREGYDKLTLGVCDMIFHHIARIDALAGMTREDFHAGFMTEDLEQGVFGRDDRVLLFSGEDKKYIARQVLRLYHTNQYAFCLSMAAEHIFPGARVNLAEEGRVMIFMNQERNNKAEAQIGFLTDLFLKLDQEVTLYWSLLPGVVEREETMVVEQFLIG